MSHALSRGSSMTIFDVTDPVFHLFVGFCPRQFFPRMVGSVGAAQEEFQGAHHLPAAEPGSAGVFAF